MILVLTGAPGAGKGTQADLLVERMGLRKLSTGDALRNQVKIKSEIGQKAESYMSNGELVPDEVLFQVLEAELVGGDKAVLLDGYPRNVAQAETLETLADRFPVKGAIHLDVDRDSLVQRLCGRRVCSQCGASFHVDHSPSKKGDQCDRCDGDLTQRPDDQPEKITVRLDVYDKNTKPVLSFYEDRGLYRKVDGNGDQEKVYQALQQAVENLL